MAVGMGIVKTQNPPVVSSVNLKIIANFLYKTRTRVAFDWYFHDFYGFSDYKLTYRFIFDANASSQPKVSPWHWRAANPVLDRIVTDLSFQCHQGVTRAA